jgi:hypothetical protein
MHRIEKKICFCKYLSHSHTLTHTIAHTNEFSGLKKKKNSVVSTLLTIIYTKIGLSYFCSSSIGDNILRVKFSLFLCVLLFF